jgi:hypothetical protein
MAWRLMERFVTEQHFEIFRQLREAVDFID